MQLETVRSNAIHAIGYDPERQVLEIIFNRGRIYQFVDVPSKVYDQLLRAESKGSYFNTHIRDQYPYWSFHAARRPHKKQEYTMRFHRVRGPRR